MTPLVDRLRALPPAARAALLDEIALRPGTLADIRYEFERFWAREVQIVTPEEVRQNSLVVFTGPRGDGKTEAAVQLFNREIYAGRAERPRIFAATEADVDKAVVHGPSGIMATLPPELRPIWIRAEGPAGVLRYRNGVEVVCFTVKAGEGAVSHQSDLDLYDDVAKWGSNTFTAWAHARVSCRLGLACGIVATTRRGSTLLRKLLGGDVEGVLVRRPTDLRGNRFNLSPKAYRSMVAEFGGTDFLRQELEDEEVGSSPFSGLEFDALPIRLLEAKRSEFAEVIVAVDPAEGKGGDHDEWGIGAAGRRHDKHVVALEDASGSFDDDEGAAAALDLCERWNARVIIVEANRGPRVRQAIRAVFYQRQVEHPGERIRPLPEIIGVTAIERKRLRAGPLRGLYLQGLLHHVVGLGVLEKQQREWDPDGPVRPRQDDRIDWLVHAVHHLADLGKEHDTPDPKLAFKGLEVAAAAIGRAPVHGSTSTIARAIPRGGWGRGRL
jgi:phage terminase large subunit-like protein